VEIMRLASKKHLGNICLEEALEGSLSVTGSPYRKEAMEKSLGGKSNHCSEETLGDNQPLSEIKCLEEALEGSLSVTGSPYRKEAMEKSLGGKSNHCGEETLGDNQPLSEIKCLEEALEGSPGRSEAAPGVAVPPRPRPEGGARRHPTFPQKAP
jgi:hypothetical protein